MSHCYSCYYYMDGHIWTHMKINEDTRWNESSSHLNNFPWWSWCVPSIVPPNQSNFLRIKESITKKKPCTRGKASSLGNPPSSPSSIHQTTSDTSKLQAKSSATPICEKMSEAWLENRQQGRTAGLCNKNSNKKQASSQGFRSSKHGNLWGPTC